MRKTYAVAIQETDGKPNFKKIIFESAFNIHFTQNPYSSDMETFIRKELKYKISDQQKTKLLAAINNQIQPDQFFDCNIFSMYFDTPNLDLLRRCEGNPGLKVKVRLRSYQPIQDGKTPVYLELKKKSEGICFKTRHEFTMSTLKTFLQTLQPTDQATREMASLLSRYQLIPQFVLYAHRRCYVWKTRADLRITIDDKLTFRTSSLTLTHNEIDESILEDGMNILEIKCASNLPLELCKVLNALKIKPASTSKAGLAYSKLMERKQQHDRIFNHEHLSSDPAGLRAWHPGQLHQPAVL